MTEPQQPPAKELTPQETAAILARILDAVEADQHKRWVEIACAVVLALATTCSAWCAYQSTLWGGVQTFRLAAAGKADRGAAQNSLEALQFRAVDAQMATAYFDAKSRGDEKLAEFLRAHFRPEAKAAFDVWLKSDPFNSTSMPIRPFELKEYVQPELLTAKRLEEESDQLIAAAHVANKTGDTYVLLTVLFATVLFFGGIGGTFQSRRLRLTSIAMAGLLFVGTVIALGMMPICRS